MDVKTSVISKTSDGLQSSEHPKKIAIQNNNFSEYAKIKSRQESSIAHTNSKDGSQLNYNSSLNNSQ